MFVCSECGMALAHAGHCPEDGTRLADNAEDPVIGTTLGPYRVARLLGVGGMGRVYKGVHPQIGSRVAIKVLSYECAQRHDLVERFFSEARAVNLIRHESIVNVLDLATLPDGRPYIIMEFLDGAPLADLVSKAGPLPLGSLARLMAEVLDALGAAHGKGIVHRDLKPDNIYVTPAGRPKVLDFGIAKLQQNVGGVGSATQTGSLLGTPHYMSPEQAMGRPVDLRTDIYAMGIILFECACGRRPFHADALYDLLRQHVETPPPSPRALRPDMPVAYEQVILATLAKDPDHRPQSAHALSQALQHATQGMGPEAWATVTPGTASAIAAQRTPASWPSTQQSWPGGTPPPGHVPATDPGAGRGAGMPAGGYPSTGPGRPPGSMQPAPPTVSSGQMVQGKPSGSGKGLWIGIAVLAVLGGGGTAAYFATRGPAATSQGAAKSGEEAVASNDEGDEVIDDTEEADPVTKEDDVDDAIDKEIEKLEESFDKLDDAADKLDQIGATAVGSGTGTGTGTGTGGGAPAIPKGGTFSSPVPLDLPAGFDPKAFDVSGYYPTAASTAQQVWPDARLVRIDAQGIRTTGLADLTLDDYSVRYWFRSEAASKRPDDIPIGVDYETTCNLQIWVGADGISLMPMSWDCDTELVPAPKCTLAQAWAKAIKIGAPSGNVVAEIGYRSNIVSHEIRWFFDIGDVFSEQIPDGC